MGKKDRQPRSDSRHGRVRILPLMGSDLLNSKNLREITDPDKRFRLYRDTQEYLDYDDLTLAALLGDQRRVEDLVAAGAKIEGSPKSGTAPLSASLGAGYVDIARFLLRSGANPKIVTESGWTPLHIASAKGFESAVAEIVDRGAEVNLQTEHGLTPLMLAARSRCPGIVRLLLKNNALVSTRDNEGMTALIYAARGDVDEIGGDFRCVELLVSRAADVDVQAHDGWTALMGASFYGDILSVRLLLAKNASVNLLDKQGRTALGLAEYRKRAEIAKLLREAGARE